MFKYDLSLIIPVYNAERYIEDTISAVVNQTIFPNVEVIIVNDGSSDDTESICEKYVKDYENIKLITQNNMGVSEARNSGLRVATGNYVTFLDADDFVEADLYEKELQLIKDNSADIGVVDFKKVHDDGTIVK
ncbi:TPA: glycosyltransferase, partial [Enterococcus faecium]|nr:glycosyltransferase [Enterococcus faecium]